MPLPIGGYILGYKRLLLQVDRLSECPICFIGTYYQIVECSCAVTELDGPASLRIPKIRANVFRIMRLQTSMTLYSWDIAYLAFVFRLGREYAVGGGNNCCSVPQSRHWVFQKHPPSSLIIKACTVGSGETVK